MMNDLIDYRAQSIIEFEIFLEEIPWKVSPQMTRFIFNVCGRWTYGDGRSFMKMTNYIQSRCIELQNEAVKKEANLEGKLICWCELTNRGEKRLVHCRLETTIACLSRDQRWTTKFSECFLTKSFKSTFHKKSIIIQINTPRRECRLYVFCLIVDPQFHT